MATAGDARRGAAAGVYRPAAEPLERVQVERHERGLSGLERPERELVRRCLAGDAEAQRELVARHTSLVWSLCRRSGLPPQEAEDVCQEVFWHVFEALPAYRGEGRLSTWLYTVARRRIVDHLRSPARRHLPSGAPGDETFPPAAAENASPESAAASTQARARVRAELDAMDEPVRSVLVAYYLAEAPVAEIARTLSLPEGTVKTHLHRGRRALRERLRDLC